MALQGVRVLIVEDDPVFRQLVSDYCRQQGMLVKQAEDGQVALQEFAKQRPDLLLVDLCMPRMGGQELLVALAKLAPEIPSIVITANKAMSDVVDALRHGAWDYLMKPLTDLQLLSQSMRDCLLEAGNVVPAEGHAVTNLHLSELLSDGGAQQALQQDRATAQMVQSQLFPAANVPFAGGGFGYTLYKTDVISDRFCDGFLADDHHFCFYLAKFSPVATLNAFISVLIRSFFNQKLKRYRQGGSQAILAPYNMLGYLNEQLVKSGLPCQIDMIYGCIDLRSQRVSLARYGQQVKPYLYSSGNLSPLLMATTAELGSQSQHQAVCHYRDLQQGQAIVLAEGDGQASELILSQRYLGVVMGSSPSAALCVQLAL